MPDEVLAKYIEQYVESQPTPVVEFVWHGGEPTLLGVDFYRRVVELQKPFRGEEGDPQLAADQCAAASPTSGARSSRRTASSSA